MPGRCDRNCPLGKRDLLEGREYWGLLLRPAPQTVKLGLGTTARGTGNHARQSVRGKARKNRRKPHPADGRDSEMPTTISVLANAEAEIGREIIRLVPHWYEAAYGPEQYSIPVGTHTVRFCNHSRLTPALRAFGTDLCLYDAAAGAFCQPAEPDRRAAGELCHRMAANALAEH